MTVTPPSVLAREKKLAIEKKKKEQRAHYCAGDNPCVFRYKSLPLNVASLKRKVSYSADEFNHYLT